MLSILSIVSSVCVWKSVWNLLEVYILPYTVESELVCGVLGMMGLWLTSSLVNSAGIVDQTTRELYDANLEQV